MNDPWIDRLSDFLDGELSPDLAGDLEAHLEECAECTRVLEALKSIKREAASLSDIPPDQDLWPAIRAQLPAREQSSPARILRFQDGGGEQQVRPAARFMRRTVRLSVPQLAAAALLVMTLSGLGTAFLRSSAQSGSGINLSPQGMAVQAALATRTGPELASELSELEEALYSNRDRLRPATLRILERNLTVIDRAIQESVDALLDDPENVYLEGNLDWALERKVALLREAQEILQRTT